MMNRILYCFLFAGFLWGCGDEPELQGESSQILRKAATFLWEKQGADGGWHSETHGILKSGQVCTAYVLDALMEVPDSIYQRDTEKVEKALEFIAQHTNEAGVLGVFDPDLMEYPNYATAFGLKCLFQHGNPEQKATAEKMKDYLLSQQFDEDRGYTPTHSAYGSWGFGEQYLTEGNPGHVDISHTRRILEALSLCGALDVPTASKARIFLMRMQKDPSRTWPEEGLLATFDSITYDGGFIYSPVQEDVNKGGWVSANERRLYMRSYASATCDGILSLLCVQQADDHLAKARQWLELHPDWSQPEGIPEDHPQQWHRVMFYYHLSVRAQVCGKLDWPGNWRDHLMVQLRGKQAEDGSFSNPDGAANKENDPLLATAMVVKALCATL